MLCFWDLSVFLTLLCEFFLLKKKKKARYYACRTWGGWVGAWQLVCTTKSGCWHSFTLHLRRYVPLAFQWWFTPVGHPSHFRPNGGLASPADGNIFFFFHTPEFHSNFQLLVLLFFLFFFQIAMHFCLACSYLQLLLFIFVRQNSISYCYPFSLISSLEMETTEIPNIPSESTCKTNFCSMNV